MRPYNDFTAHGLSFGVRTDEELYEAWRSGDCKAGNDLFLRYFESIHWFFANKVDRDSEELVQETFVRCVQGRDRYQHRSSVRTFLFAVAHNVLRESFRTKRRRSLVDFESQSVVDMGAGPASLLIERGEARVLLEALRRIPLELQVVLELYYWERMTGPQLGEVLGVPEATARSRVRKGKQLLKKALVRVKASPHVLESTASDLDGWAAKVRTCLQPPV